MNQPSKKQQRKNDIKALLYLKVCDITEIEQVTDQHRSNLFDILDEEE